MLLNYYYFNSNWVSMAQNPVQSGILARPKVMCL